MIALDMEEQRLGHGLLFSVQLFLSLTPSIMDSMFPVVSALPLQYFVSV